MQQPNPNYNPIPEWETEIKTLESTRRTIRKDLNKIKQRIFRLKKSIGNANQLTLDIDAPPWS